MTNNLRRYAVGAALLLWCGASATGSIEGIRVYKAGAGAEVRVVGSDLAKPKVIRVNANKSVLVEFQANLTGRPVYEKVRFGGVQYATLGWFSARPPRVRVHVRLSQAVMPTIEKRDNGWGIFVNAKPDQVSKREFPTVVPPLKSAKDLVATEPPAPPAPQGNVLMSAIERPMVGNVALNTTQAAKAKPVVSQPFPDKVPPLATPNRRTTQVVSADANRRVSLEFSNTDVVLVLKAMAREAQVNIVTSPEVQGKVNVSLNKVPLPEALDLVTTLASLRYAKVNGTYIVTSSAKFSEAMSQIKGKLEVNGETRVVSLTSGEGTQIKAATFKAIPQFTSKGVYDIVLSNEEIKAGTVSKRGTSSGDSAATAAGAQSGGAKAVGDSEGTKSGADLAKTTAASTSSAGSDNTAEVRLTAEAKNVGAKDTYLVVVGTPERLDDVVAMVKQLDKNLAVANNVTAGEGVGNAVIPIYSNRPVEIAKAVVNLCLRNPRKNLFTINGERVEQESDKLIQDIGKTMLEVLTAPGGNGVPVLRQAGDNQESTNGASEGGSVMPTQKMLIVSGPNDALEGIVDFAKQLDQSICGITGVRYPLNAEDGMRLYEVFDLKYIEPVDAIKAVMERVPSVYAAKYPSMVGSVTEGAAKASTESSGGLTPSTPRNEGVSSTRPATTLPMKLVLQGTRADLEEAKEFLGTLDTRPKQVAIEFRVMEMSKEDALKVGLDWSLLTGGTLRALRVNQSVGGSSGTAGNITSDLQLNNDTSASVLGTLDSIADGNKILARPNMLATDGRPSEIFVGDVIRYIESIQASQNGTTVQVGKVNVGVQFTVTPRVGADGNIVLDMHPMLSFLRGFTSVPGGGSLPQTSERRADTVMSIRSGDTIAIGGLIQDQDRKTFSGIPILKDLPLIGALFGRTETTKTRSEIVFFLTAKVVEDDERATAAHPSALNNKTMPTP